MNPTIERYKSNPELANALPKHYQKLLRLHYIESRSWEETAREMHYSLSHIYALRRKALRKLEVTINARKE